jgi:dTDP-4-amino-4,6-dideoxygalactose transaminase
MDILKRNNIGTQVHYIPVHTHPYYINTFGTKWGEFPESEAYYKKSLSIPLYPKLTDSDVSHVIENILRLSE